jgi:hypothetical protein
MEKHVRLLAVLFVVYGALHVLAGLVGWILFRWMGLYHTVVPGQMVGMFLLANTVAGVLLVFVTSLAIGCIIGGIGLLHRRRWSRILVLILSFLNLIHFPLGTALGVYGIWVLMNDQADSLFTQGSGTIPQGQGPTGPPGIPAP